MTACITCMTSHDSKNSLYGSSSQCIPRSNVMWAHGSESTSHCAKHHHIIMEVNAPLPASVTIIAYEATAVTASAAAVSRIAASADANSADLQSCRLLCRLFGLQSILGAPCYEVLLRRCPTIEVPTETGEYIPSTRPEVYDGTTVAVQTLRRWKV